MERSAFSILIVDDEPWARRELKLLLRLRSDVAIVGEADTVANTIEQLHRLRPEITFLDIKLRNEDSFSIFERTRVESQVVFLTAHADHALRAFGVDAIDYLVKPVEPELLDRALARAALALRARLLARNSDLEIECS
ncbi:MAG: response regulator [Myxococcota bacterium]